MLFYNGRTVDSVLYQKDKFDTEEEIQISSLSKCIYENGLIKNYDFANILVEPLGKFDKNNCNSAKICNEILTENFKYNNTILVSSTLESYNFDVNIISQSKYFYNYDDNKKMISYTAEEYDNGKRIPSVWDNHVFIIHYPQLKRNV